MKVLFVVKSMEIETLGVMYLSAVAKEAGHESKICELSDAVPMAKLWKPDYIGYSVMTGDQEKIKEVNEKIRHGMKKKYTAIVGGPHPTFFRDDFLDSDIDMIVEGEAEDFMAELLESNILYSDINSLPFPDRHCFPNHRIRDFISSRGCPYNCSYCYNERWAEIHSFYPRIRLRDVDKVVEEITQVNPEFAYFQDSCFGTNMSWLREFSRKYGAKVNIPYHCHARPNQVDEEFVLLLHDSNCASIRIALESASGRLREMLNRKNADLDKVKHAVKLFKKWNIAVMVQNMIGMPTSTIEEDLETLEFNIKCQPSYSWVSIFSPYPGTELGDRCKKEGWYKGDYKDITDCFFDTSFLEFEPKHIEQLECLQKIFALCVEAEYVPKTEELTHENFPKLVHKVMRRKGDRKLYGDVI